MDKIENYEVVRSFSQKKNMGNYETQDYFASYKAVIKQGASEIEIQTISDHLAEMAENDVLSKTDPSKFISRQATFAEYRAKFVAQDKRIKELEEKVSNQTAF